MTAAAAAIMRQPGGRQPVADEPAPAQLRPAWVYELVVAVLAATNQPMKPQQVIHQAERVHGQWIAPSSIRNCLRRTSSRTNGAIERVGYGTYRLRRNNS